MSELSLQQHEHWEEVDHRITDDGLDLTIRRSPDQEGNLEVLAIDENGVTEMVLSPAKALEAFVHPNTTPGLRIEPENPWDKALDAYNDLKPKDKERAAKQVQRDVEKGFFVPTLVFDAVKRQARHRELEQAA